ncbi:MliC family protein [Acuticoccus sp. M5D2P5]|uniref:MliC family protein n=1 Tax=Acuticoccus kalidii TaxID=2910977 RepID=UPI001F2251F3|nr:MliC family protein [Acuticoccus kalidii]MCF3936178.1 MliC family protein [Acuticoccus kalidii]
MSIKLAGRSLGVALVLAAGPLSIGAAIAAEPSFDCAKAQSSAEEAVCQDQALAQLDVTLSNIYQLALNEASASGDEEKTETLKAMQRGWVKGRDDCWKADDLKSCITNEYAMRIHALRAELTDIPANEPAADNVLGPFGYHCMGLPEALKAVFINTDQPMVSLNWGENWLVLPQAISADGARYAIESGPDAATFWSKGNSASFDMPGGKSLECDGEQES